MNWQGTLRVKLILPESPTVKTFRLVPSPDERLLPFRFLPGQYLNVTFSVGGARFKRSYSISSSPTQLEYVDVTARHESRGALAAHFGELVNVGDLVEASGPAGRFTFTGAEANSIVLIAGGVGITPMMSIVRYLTARSWKGEIFLVYTCRTPDDVLFAEELAALERVNPRLRVAVTISGTGEAGWNGQRGRIGKEWLARSVPDLASRRVHLCGPPLMMDSVKGILAALGVAPIQVKTEVFGTGS